MPATILRRKVTDWFHTEPAGKHRKTWCPWCFNQARSFFTFRLECLGRKGEWDRRVEVEKRRLTEEGKSVTFESASRRVMPEMGFLGTPGEYALFKKWRTRFAEEVDAQGVRRKLERFREKKIVDDFEKAVETLPPSASSTVELDWIRSHPAMARKSRMKTNSTVPVLLTVDDVLNSSAGVAPSRSAVYALQHWANHPAEFYKQLLGEQKKKAAGPDGEEIDENPDEPLLEDLEKLLKQVGAG